MQSYKDWIARFLLQNNDFGGGLAKAIYKDPQFPASQDFQVNLDRLKELNISESAMIAFRGGWKLYQRDTHKKPSEASLENRLVREVEKLGGICWKFTSPGTAGVPDRIVMARGGKVAFVEMKAPGKRMRPLQQKRAEQVLALGVPVYCLNSNQEIQIFIQEMFGDEV